MPMKKRTLGDVPYESRDERPGEIIGPVGPNISQKKIIINKTVFINTPFTVDLISKQILQGNQARNYLFMQNKSANGMWVVFGNNSSVYSGVYIAAGGFYEPYVVPYSSIHILADGANSIGVCIEGVVR
jgi:hypothetical protein